MNILTSDYITGKKGVNIDQIKWNTNEIYDLLLVAEIAVETNDITPINTEKLKRLKVIKEETAKKLNDYTLKKENSIKKIKELNKIKEDNEKELSQIKVINDKELKEVKEKNERFFNLVKKFDNKINERNISKLFYTAINTFNIPLIKYLSNKNYEIECIKKDIINEMKECKDGECLDNILERLLVKKTCRKRL